MTSSRQAILPPPPPLSIRMHWFLCTSWCALRRATAQLFRPLVQRWRAAPAATRPSLGADAGLSELRLLPFQPYIPGGVPPLTAAPVLVPREMRMTIKSATRLRHSAPTLRDGRAVAPRMRVTRVAARS